MLESLTGVSVPDAPAWVGDAATGTDGGVIPGCNVLPVNTDALGLEGVLTPTGELGDGSEAVLILVIPPSAIAFITFKPLIVETISFNTSNPVNDFNVPDSTDKLVLRLLIVDVTVCKPGPSLANADI